MNLSSALLAAAICVSPAPVLAHFQLIHAETPLLQASGDVPLRLVFWHPFENGFVMDMARPLAFYAVNKGQKIDLMDRLEPITFTGTENAAAAFAASLPVTRAGDYVLVVEPAPYLEESEDLFIQQFTKVYLNHAGLPTDWTEAQNLPTEIVPLNKPYNIVAGSTFTARVLADGKPVANAEVEVAYMAAEPDHVTNTPSQPGGSSMPGGSIVAMTDDRGIFTFGIPRAGWWGFAALGTGSGKTHAGKDLSQDAVIWVRAWDME